MPARPPPPPPPTAPRPAAAPAPAAAEQPVSVAPAQRPSEGARALAELRPLLDGVDEVSIRRPSTDPQGAAATALLVADYLGQVELREKLVGVSMSSDAVDELRRLARAIVGVVMQLGGDYLSDSVGVPGDLVLRGQDVRTTTAAALEKAMPDDQELQVWLEAIRLGSGIVDLVYDLRTLAELCTQRAATPAAATVPGGATQLALSSADAIEFALRTGDTMESGQARATLCKLWTLFVPAYDRAVTAAKQLTRAEGHERQFPALALVASHRRARRRPLSLVPPHVVAARRSLVPRVSRAPRPPSHRPSAGPLTASAARAARAPVSIPATPGLPAFDDVELIEADDVDAVEVTRSAPPLPDVPSVPPVSSASSTPPGHARESWSNTRRDNRHTVEIEVGIASESNFYLGFTENLSSGGVFVATYVLKPLGSEVEVALAFPTGEELKIRGVVRWIREGTTDGWPGMGVQFGTLTEDDEQKIAKFLSLREPMFYDD